MDTATGLTGLPPWLTADESAPLFPGEPPSGRPRPTLPPVAPTLSGLQDPATLQQSAFVAAQRKPDRWSQVTALAQRYNLSPDFVDHNFDALAKADDQYGRQREIAAAPSGVQTWLSNPDNLSVAKDEVPQVAGIGTAAKLLSQPAPSETPSRPWFVSRDWRSPTQTVASDQIATAFLTGTSDMKSKGGYLAAIAGDYDARALASEVGASNRARKALEDMAPPDQPAYALDQSEVVERLKHDRVRWSGLTREYQEQGLLSALRAFGTGEIHTLGDFMAFGLNVLRHPQGFGLTTVQSIPGMLPLLGGSALGTFVAPGIGTVAGGFLGMLPGSVAGAFEANLVKEKVDVTNDDELFKVFNDPVRMHAERLKAAAAGMTESAFVAATLPFAGGLHEGVLVRAGAAESRRALTALETSLARAGAEKVTPAIAREAAAAVQMGKPITPSLVARALAAEGDIAIQAGGMAAGQFAGQVAGSATEGKSLAESIRSADAGEALLTFVNMMGMSHGIEAGGISMRAKLAKDPALALHEYLREGQLAEEAVHHAKVLEEMGTHMRAAPTTSGTPEAIRSLVETVTAGDGATKISFTPADWDAYWTDKGLSPSAEAARIMGDDGKAYREAKAQGEHGRLNIDLARYAQEVGPTEHWDGLNKYARGRPNGKTLREGTEFLAGMPATIKELADEAIAAGKREPVEPSPVAPTRVERAVLEAEHGALEEERRGLAGQRAREEIDAATHQARDLELVARQEEIDRQLGYPRMQERRVLLEKNLAELAAPETQKAAYMDAAHWANQPGIKEQLEKELADLTTHQAAHPAPTEQPSALDEQIASITARNEAEYREHMTPDEARANAEIFSALLRQVVLESPGIDPEELAKKVDVTHGPVVAGTADALLSRTAPTEETTPAPKEETTRYPTGARRTEDPHGATPLLINLASARRAVESFKKNAILVTTYVRSKLGLDEEGHRVRLPAEYVGIGKLPRGATPEQRTEHFIEFLKRNLIWMHNQIPADIRARTKLWYEGARGVATRWGVEFGKTTKQMAGMMAALSPATDWYQNADMVRRVASTLRDHQDTAWSPLMDEKAGEIWRDPKYEEQLTRVRGKTLGEQLDAEDRAMWVRTYDEAHEVQDYRELTTEGEFGPVVRTKAGPKDLEGWPAKLGWQSLPNIAKAVRIFEDGSERNISLNLGFSHKVRSFYANIVDPGSRAYVTIDTHAVAAALLRALGNHASEVSHNFGTAGSSKNLVLGVRGTYALYHEAYVRAANDLGLIPRQLQSIVWEEARRLFPDTLKRNADHVQTLDAHWEDHQAGTITEDEARERVRDGAERIVDPAGERRAARDAEKAARAERGPEAVLGVRDGEADAAAAGRGDVRRAAGGPAGGSEGGEAPPDEGAGAGPAAPGRAPTVLHQLAEYVPPFYSQAEKLVGQKMGKVATAEELRGLLKDLRKEERDWLGLDEFLASQPKFTKDEVQTFLRANRLELKEEVHRGEGKADEEAVQELADEKMESAIQSHLDNYDPGQEGDIRSFDVEQIDPDDEDSDWVVTTDGERDTYDVFPTEERARRAMRNTRDQAEDAARDRYEEHLRDHYFDYDEFRQEAYDELQDSEPAAVYGEYVLEGDPEDYTEITFTLPQEPGASTFESPHGERIWNKRNLLAHARTTLRRIRGVIRKNLMLLIEEIQSDWHSEGRESGYRTPEYDRDVQAATDRYHEAVKAYMAARDDAEQVLERLPEYSQFRSARLDVLAAFAEDPDLFRNMTARRLGPDGEWKPGELERLDAFRAAKLHWDNATRLLNAARHGPEAVITVRPMSSQEMARTGIADGYTAYGPDGRAIASGVDEETVRAIAHDVLLRRTEGRVPDAPLKNTWHEYVLKRLIRYAADHDIDHIGITTGEQQAERYSLEKQVDELRYDPATERFGALKDGVVLHTGTYDAKALGAVVGKEVAEKLLASPLTFPEMARHEYGTAAVHRLEGTDLKVGGIGMRRFYDEIIPQYLNHFTKKWGGKVTTATLSSGQEVHHLVITPELKRAAKEEGFQLFQPAEGHAPGQEGVPAAGRTTIDHATGTIHIEVTKLRDIDTMLHELGGHGYFEILRQLVASGRASPRIAGAYGDLRAWLREGTDGVEGSEFLTTKEHEKLAQGLTTYLFEGRAPSKRLEPLFFRFWTWFKGIAEKIERMGIPITPEVRRAFATLFATDAEIAEQERTQHAAPLFPDAAAARMKPKLAAEYNETVAATHREGIQRFTFAMFEQMRKVDAAQRQGLRRPIEARHTQEVNQEPIYNAIERLRNHRQPSGGALPPDMPRMKLSSEAIKATWGQEVLDALPAGITTNDPETATNPAIVADHFGYSTPKPFLDALTAARPRAEEIKARTDAETTQRYGQPKTYEQQYAEAAAAVMEADSRPRLLHLELQILASDELATLKGLQRRINRPIPTIEEVRARAEQTIANLKVKDVNPRDFQLAAARAAKAAQDLSWKGDLHGAFRAKEQQLLHTELHRAATRAQAEITKGLAEFERFHRDDIALAKTREVNIINGGRSILALFGLAEAHTPITNYLEQLARYDPEAHADVQAMVNAATMGARDWRELSVTDFRALRETLSALWDKSLSDRQNEIDGVKRDRKELAGILANQIDRLLGHPKLREERAQVAAHLSRAERNLKEAEGVDPTETEGMQPDPQVAASLRTQLAAIDARLAGVKMPEERTGLAHAPFPIERAGRDLLNSGSWARRVEHWLGSLGAPEWLGFLFDPVQEGINTYHEKFADITLRYEAVAATLKGLMEGDPGRTVKEHLLGRHPIDAPELGYQFQSMAELLGALLHTGNRGDGLRGDTSNYRKMLLGEARTQKNRPMRPRFGDVDADGKLDSTRWEAFVTRMIKEGRLTKVHYDWLQSVWNLAESLKPEAQKANRRMFGRYFEEVTRTPFDNQFGHYEGGYFPALPDPFLDATADARREREQLLQGDNGYLIAGGTGQYYPTRPAGFTRTRVESLRPLILDAGLVMTHFDAVLRETHIAPYIREVGRLITTPELRAALNDWDPTVVQGILMPWLSRAAAQTIQTPSNLPRWMDTVANELRTRSSLQVMFANANVLMSQTTHFTAVAAFVGKGQLMSSLARYVLNHKKIATAIANLSAYMRTREEVVVATAKRNIEVALDQNYAQYARQTVQAKGRLLVTSIQDVMDHITWDAAYNSWIKDNVGVDRPIGIQRPMDERAAVRHADRIVRTVLGTNAPESISNFEAGTPQMRLLTMFAGFHVTRGNLLLTEAQKAARGPATKMQMAARINELYWLAFLAPAILYTAGKNTLAGKGPVDQKEGEDVADAVLRLFLNSQIEMAGSFVPVIGRPITSAIVQTMEGKPWEPDIVASPGIKLGGEVVRAIPKVITVPMHIWKDEPVSNKDVNDLFTLFGMIANVPLGPVAKATTYLRDVQSGMAQPTGPIDYFRGLTTGRPGRGQ